MKKAMMWMLGIFMMGGLAIGPGYWAWGEFFSGKKIGEFRLMKRDVEHASAGGFSHVMAGGTEFYPVELELSPAMNPVGLVVTSRAVPPQGAGSTMRSAAFRMTASSGGSEIWSEDFAVSYQRKKEDKDSIKIGVLGAAQFPRITERLELFRAPNAGTYTFQLEGRGGGTGTSGDLVVSEMEMTVRRNVQPADLRVVLLGVAMAIASFAGLWVLKDKL